MSLLVTEDDIFDVVVKYSDKDRLVIFEDDKAPEDCKSETFTFKKPSWYEIRKMMSESLIPTAGTVVLNPYIFMDVKLKALMVRWTLKDKEGKLLKLSYENIDMLHPSLCDHLSSKIDAMLGTAAEPKPVASPAP